MEEICFIDSLDNIRKRKVSFEKVIPNKKRFINNEINRMTNNFNRLNLKRKAEDDQFYNEHFNNEHTIKKIKIIHDNIYNDNNYNDNIYNDNIYNDNIYNDNHNFIPIENNLKRKYNELDKINLDKLDGIDHITKKIKLNNLNNLNNQQDIKEEHNNILNCNCIKICQCDYDYDYFKQNNNKLPIDDLIYRYIN
jgi:hypothetical protein